MTDYGYSELLDDIEEAWMAHHAGSLDETKMTGIGGDIPKKKTGADLARSTMKADVLMRLLTRATGSSETEVADRLIRRMAARGMTTTWTPFEERT